MQGRAEGPDELVVADHHRQIDEALVAQDARISSINASSTFPFVATIRENRNAGPTGAGRSSAAGVPQTARISSGIR